MRYVVDEPAFTPLSFRAGNWLFQPTETAASVLAERGIKVDSSVFKGGVCRRNHGLDYRRARRNGYYWSFSSDVNKPDPSGTWIEVPIYNATRPFWRMATSKAHEFWQYCRPNCLNQFGKGINRTLDLARFAIRMKLDFCRMTPVS